MIRPVNEDGQFVIKDTTAGKYFHVGEQEHFLFSQLANDQGCDQICIAFENRFAETLSIHDLEDFVDLAQRRGLVDHSVRHGGDVNDTAKHPSRSSRRRLGWRQSLLSFRIPFFDPDRILNWLEPRLRFLWTRSFIAATLTLMGVATAIAFVDAAQFISSFPDAITWQLLAGVWLIIFAATMMHEFAHGLTCKHFGGEVHEIGFLMIFFMPCLYCNVSDAWLFRENWKRLWVGLAGTYCDLVTWAIATIVWRVTLPESTINYVAWMLASVCGGRCLFNFNPLIKLDGYYLLSDALQIHNLADRGRNRWRQTLQWLLWGARRPRPESHARLLLAYGIGNWLFLGILLSGIVMSLLSFRDQQLSSVAGVRVGFSLFLAFLIGRHMTRGIFTAEFSDMFTKRRLRAVLWMLFLIGGPAVMMAIPVRDRASGSFLIRTATRVEVNALEAGFLRNIELAEGSSVAPGTPIARIEVPDLESNLTKKQAEIRESNANLRRLQAGPRPEEIAEQRLRVARAEEWVALGKHDLQRARQSFREELVQLEHEILQYEAESDYGRLALTHAEKLHAQAALSGEQLESERTKSKVLGLKLDHARAQKRSRDAEGTVEAESELARREKSLADEHSQLKLLEAGGRAEEVEAEQARLARLTEEFAYLELVKSRVMLTSSVAGVITTPRMNEKNGQYVTTGTVVCVVEELTNLVAEIAISETDVTKVKPGQEVQLRARAMPMQLFHATVERAAPSATIVTGDTQGTVAVYCRLSQTDADLRSGMTGYARIYLGQRPIGAILMHRIFRFVRTEFWWW